MYCPSHSGEWMLCNTAKWCKRFFCDWPHSWRNGFNLDALLFQLSLPLEGTRHHDDFIENRRHHDTPQNLVVDHHFGTHFGWMNPHVPAIFGVRHLLHWGADRGRILHAYYEERWSAWFSKTGWWNNRRKFRSQTSDNMDRWKAEMGRVREEKRRRKKIKEEKVRRKKIQVREKVGKSRNTVFFPMICGSNSRLAKAAGAEPAGQMRDEKLHAVVARSTFPSQNVQNTPFSDQFWKLRCRKNARRCGAKLIFCTPFLDHFWKLTCWKSARRCGSKHISKSKVQKTEGYGPLLHIEMSFCVAGAGDSAPCQKWAKRKGFVAASTTTTTTLHCTPLQLQLQLHYITLHYITLHYSSSTPLHFLHSTPLHSTSYTPLHPTPLHSTPLHYTTLHYNTTLH